MPKDWLGWLALIGIVFVAWFVVGLVISIPVGIVLRKLDRDSIDD